MSDKAERIEQRTAVAFPNNQNPEINQDCTYIKQALPLGKSGTPNARLMPISRISKRRRSTDCAYVLGSFM